MALVQSQDGMPATHRPLSCTVRDVDHHVYTIERARLRALVTQRDKAKERGETTVYADLVRSVRVCEQRIQTILSSRRR